MRVLTRLAPLLVALIVAGCERPPVTSTQKGFRGTGMVQVDNPRLAVSETVPAPQPPIPAVGPTAGEIYQNVQVLNDLTLGEFTRLMTALTEWVSPEEGCGYCHVGGNFAAEGIYTKVVSRRMIQMTREINSRWQPHVGSTGVTCYTCHRGQNVPANIWFTADNLDRGMLGARAGQNRPAASVAYASLPEDPFTALLERGENIRVIGMDAIPQRGSTGVSIQQTEATYGLMMHMSDALGVNCTYCHNSRYFESWEESTSQRVTAWAGLQMVNGLNQDYLVPLTQELPPERLGPLGDGPKVHCATCHNGRSKPLGGAPMVADYPNLTAGTHVLGDEALARLHASDEP